MVLKHVRAACVIALVSLHCAHANDRAAELIEDLRDDDVRWNAIKAWYGIVELEEPPVEALHAALDSDDWQQRQLAADLLWRFARDDRAGRRFAPYVTSRLIAVTIEGLRDDDSATSQVPGERDLQLFNAANGFRVLAKHAELAREQLVEGLDGEDYQQRFLCALALGTGGVGSESERVAAILVPHLADNDIPDDAKWSARALFMLGAEAIPHLEAAKEASDDAQQRDLLELILMNLKGAPDSIDDLLARQELNTITSVARDPTQRDFTLNTMGWLRQLPE